MINTAADAKSLVDFLKYPPVGGRSWGPTRATGMMGFTNPSRSAAPTIPTLAIAMIETRQALDAIDDILAVPGLDGVFVGPGDLSITLTNGATIDPLHAEVTAALKVVVTKRAPPARSPRPSARMASVPQNSWRWATSCSRLARMASCCARPPAPNLPRERRLRLIAAGSGR